MLLPWLIFIPFIGGLLCWQIERLGIQAVRYIALITMLLTLVITLLLWQQGDYRSLTAYGLPQWQIEYLLPWIPRFGITIHLAIDGLSLIMLTLTNILGILAILCSWNENQRQQGLFYFNLLWIITSVIGVFLAIDMFLFFIFWEMMLIPMYFLISLWGHHTSTSKIRVNTAIKFFIYMQASSLIMFISIISLAMIFYQNTGIWTFNYEDLLQTSMSEQTERIIMLGFFLAFAVKMPVVPLHGWLADTHSQAPTAGSIDLSGILVKTAAYGLLRFSLPLFPNTSIQFASIAMCLGIVGIFYGAWMAFSQIDIKRLIAYTGISQMGFILIGIYSGNYLAYQGAIIHIIAHSLSSAGMFIICGQLYERLKTRDMRRMGGLWSKLDFIPAFSLFFSAAMLGMPGTGNFIGEITILFGSFKVAPLITVIAVLGLVFSSIYSLIIMQRIYYGPAKSNKLISHTTFRERLIILILIALLIFLGLFPQPVIDTSKITIINIHKWLINTNIST